MQSQPVPRVPPTIVWLVRVEPLEAKVQDNLQGQEQRWGFPPAGVQDVKYVPPSLNNLLCRAVEEGCGHIEKG